MLHKKDPTVLSKYLNVPPREMRNSVHFLDLEFVELAAELQFLRVGKGCGEDPMGHLE